MRDKKWAHLNDEELLDEIDYTETLLNHVVSERLKVSNKADAINEYLDKLKSLYNEKRKRGLA
jgi:hypothetical protein